MMSTSEIDESELARMSEYSTDRQLVNDRFWSSLKIMM